MRKSIWWGPAIAEILTGEGGGKRGAEEPLTNLFPTYIFSQNVSRNSIFCNDFIILEVFWYNLGITLIEKFVGNLRSRWGGPKRENRTERDGTSKCYRWLAKGDLMTKTGYGYAKRLTVAGTATSAPLQGMFVLEHPETTVQQNRSRQRKDRRKKKKGTKEGI